MSEETISCTRSDLVAAFTKWERQYRENPERFWSDVRRFTKETPATYGEAAANCLLAMLNTIPIALRQPPATTAVPRSGEQMRGG